MQTSALVGRYDVSWKRHGGVIRTENPNKLIHRPDPKATISLGAAASGREAREWLLKDPTCF